MSDQPTPDYPPRQAPEIKPDHIVPESAAPQPIPDPIDDSALVKPPAPVSLAPLPEPPTTSKPVTQQAAQVAQPSPEVETLPEPASVEEAEAPTPEAKPVSTPASKRSTPKSTPAQRPSSTRAPKPEAPAFLEKRAALPRYTLVTVASAFRTLTVTTAVAVIVSTIFMWWTSPEFLAAPIRGKLAPVQATAERAANEPTAIPTPVWGSRIGVVAGHSGIATEGRTKGNVDPGATCQDGFNEAGVVMNVARKTVAQLQGRGFNAELMEEFDPRLRGYQAAAFISLHADSCEFYDDGFDHSGFKLTYPASRQTIRERDIYFEQCVRENYAAVTGLKFSPGGITANMTDYHAFSKIAPSTPAIILEVGMLSYDRDLLQNGTDRLAVGVTNGILCLLQPTSIQPTAAPARVVPGTAAPVVTPTRGIVPTATR